jgi:hypothetical protein
VEVGEVCNANPVELARKPLDLDLEDALPEPARLEPSPGHRG